MIVILCDSYNDARMAFLTFLDFIQENGIIINEVYRHCLCVETDDDLRYIFVDYRMEDQFKKMNPDIIWIGTFFEEIYQYFYLFN